MIFPLKGVELIKNLWRDRVNQVAQLPENRLTNAISLQQIQKGSVDLFHPKIKRQTKNWQKQ